MLEQELGPNGGLIYCMQYLEKNIDWLREQIKPFNDQYILFDCPGQAELYTHHQSMRNIVDQFQKWDYRLTAVNLIDSFHCTDPSLYVFALLTSLSTMLHLELPHVNVLSKIDQLERFGRLDFQLEFYTDAQNLFYLEQYLQKYSWFSEKFKHLTRSLCEMIEDYSLISFHTLNIQDKESVYELVKVIDKTNGYIFGGLTPGNESIFSVATSQTDWHYNRVAAVQEKYEKEEEAEEGAEE